MRKVQTVLQILLCNLTIYLSIQINLIRTELNNGGNNNSNSQKRGRSTSLRSARNSGAHRSQSTGRRIENNKNQNNAKTIKTTTTATTTAKNNVF